MSEITLKSMMEAGLHFGHQTKRWNPKMQKYIFNARNGIYIINLQQTIKLFKSARQFAQKLASQGGTVLFVGTKTQAKDIIANEAVRSGQPYVNERWLGGMLTNFDTIRKSVGRLRELGEMEADGSLKVLAKKESVRLQKERAKLERYLGGIADMEKLPDAVFIVDTKKERIALNEVRKLGIPVIAIVDTNCDPDGINFVIPGNDDASRAISLITSEIANAITEGAQELEMREKALIEERQRAAEQKKKEEEEAARQKAEALAAAEKLKAEHAAAVERAELAEPDGQATQEEQKTDEPENDTTSAPAMETVESATTEDTDTRSGDEELNEGDKKK